MTRETSEKFLQSIPKANVKTMPDIQKTVILKAKGIAMNGEEMYFCLFAINSLNMVPLERILSSENATTP